MKRLSIYLLLLPLFGLLSCEGNNPEWKEQYKEGGYYLVKFNPLSTEYRPYVMLSPDSKGEYRMRRLQNGGTCKEFFLMKDPFIKVDTLMNSWYIADWKWGLELSYAHFVLPMKWVDVRDPDATYVRNDFTPSASGIISQIAYVSRHDIDLYVHADTASAATYPGSWGQTSGGISTDHLAPVYLSRYYSAQDIPDVIDRKGDWQYTKEDFLKERLRQDSLQNVYRKRLEQLVYSGLISLVITPVN